MPFILNSNPIGVVVRGTRGNNKEVVLGTMWREGENVYAPHPVSSWQGLRKRVGLGPHVTGFSMRTENGRSIYIRKNKKQGI